MSSPERRGKRTLSVELDKEEHAALKEMAYQQRTSLSGLVRPKLRELLDESDIDIGHFDGGEAEPEEIEA